MATAMSNRFALGVGSVALLAAVGTTWSMISRCRGSTNKRSESRELVSYDPEVEDIDLDDDNKDGDDGEDFITPDDVVAVFDSLFLNMQQVIAQLSQQISQIQAAGQMIPEPQLRQLLKQEFERALQGRQPQIIEHHDMDEDCFEEATKEFLSQPDKYPKVKKAVTRFQKLYENISGESVSDDGGDGSVSSGKEYTADDIINAAGVYFSAISDAMKGIVEEFKAQGANITDRSVAQAIHMKFATVANDVAEEALKTKCNGMTHDDFKRGIEQHSSKPQVGHTLGMLQMQQQQELMAMGVPMM